MAEDRPQAAYNGQDITEEHSFDRMARGLADGSVSRKDALKVLGGMDKSSSQEKWRKREDAALVAGGFEAIGGDLWKKGNCIYGRRAALQESRRKLSKSTWEDIFNRDQCPRSTK